MSQPDIPEPTTLVSIVETAWREATKRSKGRDVPPKRTYVYASGWRQCVRSMALDMLHPEDNDFDEDSLERMDQGDAFEDEVYAKLLQAGRLSDPPFKVAHGQRHFELQDRKGRKLISGKLDGALEISGFRMPIPFEVKGGKSVERIERLEDFELSPWTRPMPRQLASYLLGTETPLGFFVLRTGALPRFVPVLLDDVLEMAEQFLKAAEIATEAAHGERKLPDYDRRLEVCSRCPHYDRTCIPPHELKPAEILTDDMVARIKRRDQLEANAKEFRKLDKGLKKELRGAELAVGGGWIARGHWQAGTGVDWSSLADAAGLDPEDYRVSDPRKTFKLKFEKAGA